MAAVGLTVRREPFTTVLEHAHCTLRRGRIPGVANGANHPKRAISGRDCTAHSPAHDLRRSARSSVTIVAARGAQTPLITEAELSYDEQFRIRRRRYVVMMVMRVPCLILATVFYHTLWLAMIFVIVSIPLPWIAVLIANDRPARKQRKATPGTINHERALPAGGYQLIEGSVEEADSPTATGNPSSGTAATGTTPGANDPDRSSDPVRQAGDPIRSSGRTRQPSSAEHPASTP